MRAWNRKQFERTNVVCLGGLLEPGLGVGLAAGVLVGVPPHGQPAVGPAEVVVGGVTADVQDLVVVP